ncbi:MAG: replicative DNA helicase [Armatimonadetes bacterium]|nr:replicative DNA helicase [Candidatus Hippobium faecium]
MGGLVPPNNIDAEKSLLGSVLSNEDAASNTLSRLKASDFYRPIHKDIYSAMYSVYLERKPIDLITVANELKKQNKLDNVGGSDYLTSLIETVPTAYNYEEYANIIEEKSLLRQLINASAKISSLAYGDDEEAQKIVEKSEKLIFDISDQGSKTDFKHIKSLLINTYDWINKIQNGNSAGLPTGFSDIDRITNGLQKGELIILAARPSMGKTALAMNIAVRCAKQNATVAIFSLEMSAESLTQRIVTSESKANMQSIKKGKFNQDELNKITEAANLIYNTDLYIDESTDISPINMLTKARKLKSEKGSLDLIAIDYLQMVRSPKEVRDNRVLEVSMISRGLKNLAREMNCPVICLSQLTRAVENRPDHRPMLADLRESGSIEADADIVMMLYRPKYYEKKEIIDTETAEGEITDEPEDEICELIIAKHRNGPTGTINLKFVSNQVSFYSLDENHTEN